MPITITTKGWITLHRDGALISQHTVESKAIEAALEHAEANGDGDYELRFPNKVLRVLLTKTVLPFRWSAITVSLTAGTATSVNVAQYLNNPDGRPVTFTVSGTLPTGATLSSAGLLTFNGATNAVSASVQFVATSGGLVAQSSVTTVSVAPPPLQNTAPVFSVAPATVELGSNGGTIQFTAVDPQGDTVSYSLPTTRTGITINASTGLVTVTSSAAGTAGSILVRASDGSLTADHSCAVTVESAATGTIIYLDTFDARTTGAITGSVYDGGTETWRRNFNGTSPPSTMEFTTSDPLVGTSKHFRTELVKSGVAQYRSELTLLPYGRVPMTPITVGGVQNYYMPYDYWVGFRWRCDRYDTPLSGYEYVGGHLCQWHNEDSDPGLDSSKSPPLSLWLTVNGVRVYHEANDDNGGSDAYSPYVVTAPFVGTAYDFMFRIRWDTRTNAQGGSGAVDLYVNDATTPTYSWRGQTCHPYPYTNGTSPYFRFGTYMGYWRDPGWPVAMDGKTIGSSYDHFTLMGADGSRLGVKPPLPR